MKTWVEDLFIPLFLILLATFLSCSPNNNQESDSLVEELSEDEKRKIENALAGLDIADGLEVSLFASEPMLINPTNIDVDAKGRVWVCEAYNYRPRLNAGNDTLPEGDRIVILEDTDDDGQADQSTVFYQGNEINAALGIAVLGNKVIVSCSPNVWIFTDQNGDDKADKKELLFTGIGGEQHDHAVHAFVFGPDGKLYFNFGNEGKQIFDKQGNPVIDKVGQEVNSSGKPYRQGMIFRCNPDGSEFEVLAHNFRNNYEVAVDSYGGLWQSDNDDDGNKGVRINYVMEYGNYGYTDEMTGAGWRAKRTNMHAEIPKRHWHLNDPGVVPNLLQTGAGSPTGIIVYEGRLLPEKFWDQMIHTDAGPNVVRAYPVTRSGAGYQAEIVNILKGSRDAWFRPVDVCVAPDGSLIIADWYDPGVGGHQMGDQQKGRIYRVAPQGTSYKVPKLDLSTSEAAVNALQSPNHATRYLGWQQLKENGQSAESALESLLTNTNTRMKARAIWLLAIISEQPEKYIIQTLEDADEDIRVTGLRVARSTDPENLTRYLKKMIDDPSMHVKREIAIALRYLNDPKAADLWVALALQYKSGDRWFLEALGIAADPRPDIFFDAWTKRVGDQWNSKEGHDLIWRMRSKDAIPFLGKLIGSDSIDLEAKKRYFRALDFHNDPVKDKLLANLTETGAGNQAEIQRLILNHISSSALHKYNGLAATLDKSLPGVKGTSQYLEWVRKFDLEDQYQELENLMLASPNEEIGQEAARILREKKGMAYFQDLVESKDASRVTNALEALRHIHGEESWALKKYVVFDESRDIAIRRQAVKVLGSGWEEEDKLLKMMVADEVPEDLREAATATLMNAYKESVREKSLSFLKNPQQTEMKPISELVALSGEVGAGHKVFEKLCQSCHQVQGKGLDFGPDLTEIGSKLSKDGLYTSIIYPSAGISFGYEGYVLTLKDQSKDVGYIASRTETSIDLRKNGGITTTYQLEDVVAIEALENSLMIEGLTNAMNQQELVDLVSYLESLKKVESQTDD
ncbi:c-type cytochrome [Fulvivirgaceae bacterium BMA12]|uniref:C-type cytochrome n=1 Tax=Agaribacillus aureus TaxID=3051825 RepID=A0ABT8L384_9BACT|nr:c-type cytochrome [Fulvivirgaceae bacterium BMA12]